MKKIILLFILLWIVTAGFALINTFPWTEDFEGTFLPAGWAKEIPDASNDITQSNSQNHTASGTYSARFSSFNSSSDYNQYLFTDAIQVNSSYTQLTFWVRKYNSSAEELYWGFATSQNSTSVSTWHDISSQLSNSEWTKITVDLSSEAGNTIYIAWHYYGSYLYYVYLDDVNIDALPACPDPSDQTQSTITATQADLGWTQLGSPTTWEIEWGAAGFTQGSGTTITGVTSNPYTLTGLSANTQYDWYVRADCGGGQYSNWIGPSTFTTRCATISTFPWTEDFSTWPPACWDLTGGNDTWEQYSSGSVDCAKANYWNQSSGTTDIMTTPVFDVSGLTTPSMNFDWSHKYNTNYPGDSLSVEISDDNGTTWHQIWAKGASDLDSGDGAANSSPGTFVNSGNIDLSSYGTTILIRFYGTSGWGPDLFVDNVEVREMPTCLEPSNQNVTNIAQTQANLAWTDNNTSTPASWDIEYGPTGFTQGSGTIVNVTANPYTLTGLTANTTYDWYVRAKCGLNGNSGWIGPSTFTTLCAPTSTFPYTYGFEDQTSANNSSCASDGSVTLVSCWRNITGEGSDWKPLSGSTASSSTGPSAAQEGSIYMYTETSASCGPVFDLYSPQFDFSSLTTPYLEFYYHMYGGDIGTVQVLTSLDNGATIADTLWEKSGDQGNSWQLAQVTIGHGGASNVTLIWRHSNPSGYEADVSIDNITVKESPSYILDVVTPDLTGNGSIGYSQEYFVTIKNIGVSADAYDLSTSGNSWNTTFWQNNTQITSTPTVNPGDSTDVIVKVDVPTTANLNDTDTATIIATSQGDNTVQDSTHITTTAVEPYEVDVTPDATEKYGFPAQTVKFEIQIENKGGFDDNYDLALTGNTWQMEWVDDTNTTITNSGTIFSGAVVTQYINVHVPTTRAVKDSAMAYVTSTHDTSVIDSFKIIVTQLEASGGPDTTGYTWKNKYASGGPTYNWVNLTSKTEITGLGDDAYAGPFDIGFNFTFYGHTYTQFYVGSNGIITFGSGSTSYSNQQIPNPSDPDSLIAWFWDDLDPGDNPDGDTHVYYAKTLVGSDSCLVVSFLNYHEYPGNGPGKLTAQVILYPNGDIKMQYQSLDGGIDLSGATIGIENEGGTDGLLYEYNQNKLENEMVIMFYAPSTTLPVPSNVAIAISGNDVNLSWDTVSGASSYIIYRATDPFGTFTQIGTSSTNSYTDTNAASSADKYFYYVKASTASPILITHPQKPHVVIEHYRK